MIDRDVTDLRESGLLILARHVVAAVRALSHETLCGRPLESRFKTQKVSRNKEPFTRDASRTRVPDSIQHKYYFKYSLVIQPWK